MSAQENLNKTQFVMMHVNDIGRARSGDYGTTMGEAAGDDYARWQMDQHSPVYHQEGEYEKLSSDVAEHGVTKPLELSTHVDRTGRAVGLPVVEDGHHRYFAAYDNGQTHVPVRVSTAGIKALRAARLNSRRSD